MIEPAYLLPMGGPGIFEFQADNGEQLYRMNATAKPTNAGDWLKPNLRVEAAGGSPVQWQMGDGLPTGGPLMFQMYEQFPDFQTENATLSRLMVVLSQATYLANTLSGTRCAIYLGNPSHVVPIRGATLYGRGYTELNIYVTPKNRLDAALVLRGGL